jgi:predicted small metal-binding protein
MRNRSVFGRLDATGEFHRDSRLGRVFHPGTDSYREIAATDSLHIAVSPDNHISVHVDRVSPLSDRADRSRYSLLRALHHNVAHGIDSSFRLLNRRAGHHRCELDCEVKVVQDDATSEAPEMYEFSCRAAGAQGCRWRTRAASEEELLANVTEHARTAHAITSYNNTLANYARAVARLQRGAPSVP